MTSALLKLPQKLSRSKKEERVEQILEELVCFLLELLLRLCLACGGVRARRQAILQALVHACACEDCRQISTS